MKLTIYKIDGKSSGKKADLNDSIFAIEPNETVLYEDVRRILANKRQGTAKTKERSEVRGGGRKAYKQKGTGMARRGSIRSPLLKGGGTVFGPKPRTYTIKLTKKAKRLARKSALSLKASADAIMVIEDFTFESPKTKQVSEILSALELNGKKVMILTADTDMNVYTSARNIPGVSVFEAYKPTTYEIMNADIVLFQKSAIPVLESTFEQKVEEEAA
ncbi:MAG: 50S ribosomal protein L4 [Balneolaceae bacterium]|nr:MAG: 50S ribosomal protein L4 [Balneolaceae bacterium]